MNDPVARNRLTADEVREYLQMMQDKDTENGTFAEWGIERARRIHYEARVLAPTVDSIVAAKMLLLILEDEAAGERYFAEKQGRRG